jgi:hypothetical protein
MHRYNAKKLKCQSWELEARSKETIIKVSTSVSFISFSCDVRYDVPSSYFNSAFYLDDELGEWSFVELAQYSSLLAAAYNIIHNKQVPSLSYLILLD